MGFDNLNQQLSLINCALFLILGLLALINRYRDRVTTAFSLFALVMAGGTAVSLFVDSSASLAQFSTRVRLSFITFSVVPLAVLNHVMALTDYRSRREEQVLGVRLRTWWRFVLGFTLLMIVLLQIPGVLVTGYVAQEVVGFKPVFRTALLPAMALVVAVFLLMASYLVVQSLRSAREPSLKRFLWLNLVGALTIVVTAPIFKVVLPAMELPGEGMMPLSMGLASVIFFHAINSYQLDRLHELTTSLEAKVLERTRHLEQAQARLIRSQKLATAGRLAAGVTHEVNTPVGAILSTADTMERSLGRLRERTKEGLTGQELQRELERILGGLERSNEVLQDAGQRVRGLMANLQGLVGLDAPTLEEVDLNQCLEDTLALMKPELGEELLLEKHLGEVPLLMLNRADLGELLGHLLRNAAQAMDGVGRVTVTTKVEDAEVVLQVADNGPGIPEDQLEELFEPRFTNDGSRVKLGVGLATSYRIAEQRGGTLTAQQGKDGGAVLTLRLPT